MHVLDTIALALQLQRKERLKEVTMEVCGLKERREDQLQAAILKAVSDVNVEAVVGAVCGQQEYVQRIYLSEDVRMS